MSSETPQHIKKPQPAHNLGVIPHSTTQGNQTTPDHHQTPEEILTVQPQQQTPPIQPQSHHDKFGRRQSLPTAASNLGFILGQSNPNDLGGLPSSTTFVNQQGQPQVGQQQPQQQQSSQPQQQQQSSSPQIQQQIPQTQSADHINNHPNNQLTDYAKKISANFNTAHKALEELEHVRLKRSGIMFEAFDPIPANFNVPKATIPTNHIKIGPNLSVPKQHYYQHIFTRYNGNFVPFLIVLSLCWVLLFLYDMIFLAPSLTAPVNTNKDATIILFAVVTALRVIGIVTILAASTIVILTWVYGDTFLANEKARQVQKMNKKHPFYLTPHTRSLPNLLEFDEEGNWLEGQRSDFITYDQSQQQSQPQQQQQQSYSTPKKRVFKATSYEKITQSRQVAMLNPRDTRDALMEIYRQDALSNTAHQILHTPSQYSSETNLDVNSHLHLLDIPPTTIPHSTQQGTTLQLNNPTTIPNSSSSSLTAPITTPTTTTTTTTSLDSTGNVPIINTTSQPKHKRQGSQQLTINGDNAPSIVTISPPSPKRQPSLQHSQHSQHSQQDLSKSSQFDQLSQKDQQQQQSKSDSTLAALAAQSQQNSQGDRVTISTSRTSRPKHRRTPSSLLYSDADDEERTDALRQSLIQSDITRLQQLEKRQQSQQPHSSSTTSSQQSQQQHHPLPSPPPLPTVTSTRSLLGQNPVNHQQQVENQIKHVASSVRYTHPPLYPSKFSQFLSLICCCYKPHVSPHVDDVTSTLEASPPGSYKNAMQILIDNVLNQKYLTEHVLISATNVLIILHILICYLYKSLDLVQNVIPIIFFSFLTLAFSHVHWTQLTIQTCVVAIVHIVLYALQIAQVDAFNIPSLDADTLQQIAAPASKWDGIILLLTIVVCYIYQIYATQFIIKPETHLSFYLTHGLEQNEKTYFSIVKQLLPTTLIQKYKQNSNLSIWQRHTSVTIMFIYLTKFDIIAAKKSAQELVMLLNNVFSAIDVLTHYYRTWGAYKIETVSEVYMISSGSPYEQPLHADVMCDLAIDIVKSLATLFKQLSMKIGINSGPIVAGIIGIHYPRYRVIGDTVNTSSRMSSTTAPGTIQLSSSTMRRICAPLRVLLWEYSEGLIVQDAKVTKAKLYKKLGELREKRQYYELTAQLEDMNKQKPKQRLIRKKDRERQQEIDIEMGILSPTGDDLIKQHLSHPNGKVIETTPGKPALPPLHRINLILPPKQDDVILPDGTKAPPQEFKFGASINRKKSNSVLVAGYNSNMSFSQKQLVSLLKEKMYKKHIEKYNHTLTYTAEDSKHFKVLSLGIKEVKGKGKMSTWQLLGRMPGTVRRYEPCSQTVDHNDSDNDGDDADDLIGIEPLEVDESIKKLQKFNPNKFTANNLNHESFCIGNDGIVITSPTPIAVEELQQQPLPIIQVQQQQQQQLQQQQQQFTPDIPQQGHGGPKSIHGSTLSVHNLQSARIATNIIDNLSQSERTDEYIDDMNDFHNGQTLPAPSVRPAMSFMNESMSVVSPTPQHHQLSGLHRLAKQVGYEQPHNTDVEFGLARIPNNNIGMNNNQNDPYNGGLMRASSVLFDQPLLNGNNQPPQILPTPTQSNRNAFGPPGLTRSPNTTMRRNSTSQNQQSQQITNTTSPNQIASNGDSIPLFMNDQSHSHFPGMISPKSPDTTDSPPQQHHQQQHHQPGGLPTSHTLGGGKLHQYKTFKKGTQSVASGSIHGSDDSQSIGGTDNYVYTQDNNNNNNNNNIQIPPNVQRHGSVQTTDLLHTSGNSSGTSLAPPMLMVDGDGFVHNYKKPMLSTRAQHRHTVMGPDSTHQTTLYNNNDKLPTVHADLNPSDDDNDLDQLPLQRENSDDQLVAYWEEWASMTGAYIMNFQALVDDKRLLYQELKDKRAEKSGDKDDKKDDKKQAPVTDTKVPLVSPSLGNHKLDLNQLPNDNNDKNIKSNAITINVTSPTPAALEYQSASPLPHTTTTNTSTPPPTTTTTTTTPTPNKKDEIIDMQEKALQAELQKLSAILSEPLDSFLAKEQNHSDDELIDNATNVQSYYMRGNETTLFLYPADSKAIISPFSLEFYTGKTAHRLNISNLFFRSCGMNRYHSSEEELDSDDETIQLPDDDVELSDDDDQEASGILCWKQLSSRERALQRQKALQKQKKKDKKVLRKKQRAEVKKMNKQLKNNNNGDNGMTSGDDTENDGVEVIDVQLDDNNNRRESTTWNQNPQDVEQPKNMLTQQQQQQQQSSQQQSQRPQFQRGSVATTFAQPPTTIGGQSNNGQQQQKSSPNNNNTNNNDQQQQQIGIKENKKRFTVHLPKPLLQEDLTTFTMSKPMVRTLETGYLQNFIYSTSSSLWWLTFMSLFVFAGALLPYILSIQYQQAVTITLSKLPANTSTWRIIGTIVTGILVVISWLLPLIFLRQIITTRYWLKGQQIRLDERGIRNPTPAVARLRDIWVNIQDKISKSTTPHETEPPIAQPDEWVEGTGVWKPYFAELLRLFYFGRLGDQTQLKYSLDLNIGMYYTVLTSYFVLPHALLLLLWFIGIHTTTLGCILLYLTLFSISVYTFISFKLTLLWTLTTYILTIILTIVGTNESTKAKTWYIVLSSFFSFLILFQSYIITLNRRIQYIQSLHLYHDHTQSLTLFEKLLPQEILSTLDRRGQGIGQGNLNTSSKHQFATVLFADVVNFTVMSALLQSEELVLFLNMMFSVFDQLSSARGVYKVETIGDCYFACTNVVQSVRPYGVDPNELLTPSQYAENMVYFAMDIIFYLSLLPHPLASKESRQVRTKVLRGIFRSLHRKSSQKETWEVFLQNETQSRANAFGLAKIAARKKAASISPVMLRVGIHTGDVVAGVVGRTNPRYHIFGKTVTLAQKMESSGYPGRVSVSATTRNFLPKEWNVVYKKTLILEGNNDSAAQHVAPSQLLLSPTNKNNNNNNNNNNKDGTNGKETLNNNGNTPNTLSLLDPKDCKDDILRTTPRHNNGLKTLTSGLVVSHHPSDTPVSTPSSNISSYHASAARRKSMVHNNTMGPDEGLIMLQAYPEDEMGDTLKPLHHDNNTNPTTPKIHVDSDNDEDDGDVDFLGFLRSGPDSPHDTDNHITTPNNGGTKPKKEEEAPEEAIRYMELFMIRGHEHIDRALWFPESDTAIWPPHDKAKPNHRYF